MPRHRIIPLIVVLSALASLTGCGSDADEAQPARTQETASATDRTDDSVGGVTGSDPAGSDPAATDVSATGSPSSASQTTDAEQSGPDTTSPGTAGADTSVEAVPALTGPLALTLEPTAQRAAIGPDGGTITVTDASGTAFVLQVPPDALLEAVEITATPVATFGNIEFDAGGVVFGPSGLTFLRAAELHITPTTPIPVEDQFMFGFGDDGTVLGAAEPRLDTADIVIVVPHFSGYGFGDVTDAQEAAHLERQASDAETEISSEVNELLGQEREAQLAGEEGTDLGAQFEEWNSQRETLVIQPRLDAASSSCAAAKKAIATVIGYERQRQLMGLGESGHYDLESLIRQGLPACEREAIEQCKAAKDPSILLQFWIGVERQFQLMGSSGPYDIDEAKAIAICDPKSYSAAGGAGDFSGTGIICNLAEPFTISGGGLDIQFVPSTSESGSYSYAGSLSGFSVSGEGTYTVTLDPETGGGVINAGGGGQAQGNSGSGDEIYDLTPAEPC